MKVSPIKTRRRNSTVIKLGSFFVVFALAGSMMALIIPNNNTDQGSQASNTPIFSVEAISQNIHSNSYSSGNTLVTISTNSSLPNVRIPCPGCGGGGSTYMNGEISFNQKDNPLIQDLLYYVEVFLNVNSFNACTSGYDASISAAAVSTFYNWQMISDTLSVSENAALTQITAYSNSEFYGMFPLGANDYWWTYPQVDISINNSGTIHAYVYNLIITSALFGGLKSVYYDGVIFNGDIGSITSYSNIIQYVAG